MGSLLTLIEQDDQNIQAPVTQAAPGTALPGAPADGGALFKLMSEEPKLEPQAEDIKPKLEAITSEDPAQARRSRALSDQTGIAEDVVSAAPDEAERTLKINTIDETTKDAPRTREVVQDPMFGPYLTDDIKTFSDIESITNVGRQAAAGLVREFGGTGITGIGELASAIDRRVTAPMDELFKSVFGFTRGTSDTSWYDPNLWFLQPTEIFKRGGRYIESIGKDIDVEDDSTAAGVARAAGQMTGQIGTAIVSPWAGLAMMLGSGARQMQQRVEGADPDDRGVLADLVGGKQAADDVAIILGSLITAGTEKLTNYTMLDRLPPNIKNDVVRNLVDIGVAATQEAAQELAEGVLQGLAEMLFVKSDADILGDIAQEMEVAGIAGGLFRSVVNGVRGVRSHVAEQERAVAAKEYKDRISQILDAAGQSPVMIESPQLFQDVLDRIVEGSDVETIRVNAGGLDAFFQAAGQQDGAAEFFEMTGIDEREAVKAARLGYDVGIPASALVAALNESDMREGVLANVRSADGMPTLAEMEVITKDRETEIASAKQSFIDVEGSDEIIAAATEFGSSIAKQAMETGIYNAKGAQNIGLMAESALLTAAKDWHMEGKQLDVETFLKDFLGAAGITVRRVQSDGSQDLNQAAAEVASSPEFQAWFGESKIVGEDGAPMVMYHGAGTLSQIDEFKIPNDFRTRGVWFTPSKRYATGYARKGFGGSDTGVSVGREARHVIPVYLSIKNPVDLRGKEGREAWRTAIEAAREDGGSGDIVSLAQQLGHDGIIFSNGEYVVFEPTQIKSIFNQGTFDPNNPNILKQDALPQSYELTKEDKARIAELKKSTPGLAPLLKYLQPDEQALLTKASAKNLVELYAQMPNQAEMAAVAFSGRAKRGWYSNSAKALVEIFGEQDAPRFAALLAALSPQVSVESNTTNALNMWRNWNEADRPTDRAEIIALMARSVQGNKGEDSVLGAWINNTVTALSAPDPSAIAISGPKVNSFMLNLMGFMNEVTNDAWMANYANVDQAMFSKNQNAPLPGKGAGYLAMSIAARRAAETLSKKTGEAWTPAEVQETVWSWAKALYEKRAAAGETRPALQILQSGDLTHEEVNSVPDFEQLFLTGAYRDLLTQAGYGDKLAAVEQAVASRATETIAGSAYDVDAADRAHLHRAAKRLDELAAARAAAAVRTEVKVTLSATTGTIPGLNILHQQVKDGDDTAGILLQEIAADALRYLTTGIKSVEIGFTPATGLYGGDVEPSLGLSLSFQERDREATLAALAKFAENFNQEQVHVRGDVEPRTGYGHIYEDGSFNTLVVRYDLVAPLSREQVQEVIDASGLFGLTVTDTYLEAYYVGDPTDAAARQEFAEKTKRARASLGKRASGVGRGYARLWAYGEGYGATSGYGAIRRDVRPARGDQAVATAQRVASRLAGRAVAGTEQAAKITEEQAALQRRIAEAYEAMRVNALDDPNVMRAYRELAIEVQAQFDALPIKVEIFTGKGEPYTKGAGKKAVVSSEKMRQDVLLNNHLFIFATTPEGFGPEGETYDNHPLLADSGRTDVNGKPLLFNDLLRAVHDYYAHTITPTAFGPKGEEAAWRTHMEMTVSPWARWALTSETRGQNSWVNFREEVDGKPLRERGFAEQKVDLLPLEFSMTGDAQIDAALGELPGGEGLVLDVSLNQSAPFYSQLTRAAQTLNQLKGSGDQMLAMLKKAGVKDEELAWTGMDEFLAGKKTVTRDEIVAFAQENAAKIEVVLLGDTPPVEVDISRARAAAFELLDGGPNPPELREIVAEIVALLEENRFSEAGAQLRDNGVDEAEIAAYLEMVTPPGAASSAGPGRHTDSSYVTTGGQNPVELVITVPGIEPFAQTDTTHYGDIGGGTAVAWIRGASFVDADGKKVFLVDELQSKRHQTGREKGYRGDNMDKLIARVDGLIEPVKAMLKRNDNLGFDTTSEAFANIRAADPWAWEFNTPEDAALAREYHEAVAAQRAGFRGGVPDAPFKKTWQELGMRYAARYAAENGFDRVAWTVGETQAERYDLSKQVSAIGYDGKLLEVDGIDGNPVFSGDVAEEDLADHIGKETAERLLAQPQDGFGQQVLTGLDLKIGGEGMIGFYDKILPAYAKKFGKKFGAGTGMTNITVRGGRPTQYRSYDEFITKNEGAPQPVHYLDVTDAMRESVINEGVQMFQTPEGPRGSIHGQNAAGDRTTLTDPNRVATIINLFENADLSTLLHESGHLYVAMLEALAKHPDAPKRTKDNYIAMLNWVGATSADDLDLKKHGDAARYKQEKLAVAFEAYLREGRAPNPKLQSAFAQFQAWLVRVYDGVRKRLGVKIDDRIRQVFDRLLATDAEINEMVAVNHFAFGDSPAILDIMTPEERAKYLELADMANEQAKTERRLAEEEASKIEEQEWWKKELATTKTEIEDEFWSRPQYRAFWYLTHGSMRNEATPAGMANRRIDRDALIEMGLTQAQLDKLPSMGKRVYGTGEGATDPELLAAFLGFDSGREMIDVLTGMVPPAEALQLEAEMLMRTRHGDPLNDGSMTRITEEKLFNDHRRAAIQAELNVLAKKAGQTAPTRAIVKAIVDRVFAEEFVGQLLTPLKYQAASVRAAKDAERAAAKKDWPAAMMAKRQQLLNHELFRRSLDAQREVEKITTKLRRYQRQKLDAKTIDPEYIAQVKSLLQSYELGSTSQRKFETSQQRQVASDVLAFVEAKRAAGEPVILPGELIELVSTDENGNPKFEFKTKHWRQMTMAELRALRDMADNLVKRGRSNSDNEKAILDAKAKALAESIRDNTRPRKADQKMARPTREDQEKQAGKGRWMASHRKMSSILRELDGFKDLGPMWRAVFEPLAKAADTRAAMVRKIMSDYDRIFDAYDRKTRWAFKDKKGPKIAALGGRMLTHEQRLSIALNWGNESSREAVLDDGLMIAEYGDDWNESAVNEILATLTDTDWNVVEQVWQMIDGYWPQIAALEQETTGVTPAKVAASAFTVGTRTLQGGYYPLKYDNLSDHRAARETEADIMRRVQSGGFARAHTSHGFTNERVGSGGRPVRLDLGVLMRHLDEVAQDIAYREAVTEAAKILGAGPVREAIMERMGAPYLKALEDILVKTANGGMAGSDSWMDNSIFRTARLNVTAAVMGFNLRSILTQPIGITQSISRIGVKAVAHGFVDMYINPTKTAERIGEVNEKSEYMRQRAHSLTRELDDLTSKIEAPNVRKSAQRLGFSGMVAVDVVAVSYPAWIGAYDKALAGKVPGVPAGSEDDAVAYADNTVRDTQGSGGAQNLSMIQQSSEFAKLITMFYGYFNTTMNLEVEAYRKSRLTGNPVPFIGQTLLLSIVPAIVSGLLLEAWPNDDDDEEDTWVKWGLLQVFNYATGQFVLVRDLANMATSGLGFSMSPVESLFGGAAKGVRQAVRGLPDWIDEGEVPWEFVKNLARVTGMALGIPGTNQLVRIVDTAVKMDAGEMKNEPRNPLEAAQQLLLTGDR